MVDVAMTYGILAIGLLLLLGLFTRAGLRGRSGVSVVGGDDAAVLGQRGRCPRSTSMSKCSPCSRWPPPQVGRWGGLDFFLAQLISGRRRSTKGKTDVSES